MVSFERVFEVLDLLIDIQEKSDAKVVGDVQGRVKFDGVSFSYGAAEGGQGEAAAALSRVVRWGEAPAATMSLVDRKAKGNGAGTGDKTAESKALMLTPIEVAPDAPSEKRYALR